MLFVFSAPSGSGKTTIVKEILNIFPQLRFSVSATSRKKRDGETDGKDYLFLAKSDFEEKIKNNEFVEYEQVYDNTYYGTLKEQVDDCLSEGGSMVFDVDVKGALSIKRLYGKKSVLIFVNPPDKTVLIERLRNRGTESEDELNKRIDRMDFEFEKIDEFDYVVTNDELSTAIEEAKQIINKYLKEQS
jgi:guanylate kinase